VPRVSKAFATSDDEGARAAIWRLLIGRPLRVSETSKEHITPVEGLPALSLDALTSVAYGPEAMLLVLGTAGVAALHLVLPITIAIIVLLTVLVFSYRQVIDAYPGGGGAYAVARENFGARVGLVAGGALIIDYTLTVAVSISAGVQLLTSAFPRLTPATVPIDLGLLVLITVLNLRGLGDSARAFLLPTLVFIVGLLAIIAVGIIHPLDPHAVQSGTPEVATHALETVGLLLVLRAFAAGCSALTGVEAIANGVPLFKEPRVVRAKRTEALLGSILGVMLLGLAILAVRFHIEPRTDQTVLSQIMVASVGRNWAFYIVSLSVTVVLALAANTSFGGLPVLASLLSRDHYLPHLFSHRGDRQVFSTGILTLAVLSGALLIAVDGNTQRLIPLFAIGVFIGFTLAQGGLVVHWRRLRPPRWRSRAAVNAFGAATTAISTVIFVVSKFTQGGWVVVVAIPAFIFLFMRIHRYYARVAAELGIGVVPPPPQPRPTSVIVPVTNVSRLTARALSEALSICARVVAVTVARTDEREEAAELERLWSEWDPGAPLVVLYNEYASIVDPLIDFIDEESRRQDQLVVLIPVVVPKDVRYRILHNHLDLVLTNALKSRTDVIVARVRMELDVDDDRSTKPEALERPRPRAQSTGEPPPEATDEPRIGSDVEP
jgi:amino acid transporter